MNKVVNPDFWNLSSESKFLNFRLVKYLSNFNENQWKLVSLLNFAIFH